jgi:hypothetical protein
LNGAGETGSFHRRFLCALGAWVALPALVGAIGFIKTEMWMNGEKKWNLYVHIP